MATLFSPDLPYVIDLPWSAPLEVHEKLDAAMREARMWPFVADDGSRVLVNPAALRVVTVVDDDHELPEWAAARPRLSVTPQWTVPDEPPIDLVPAATATPELQDDPESGSDGRGEAV